MVAEGRNVIDRDVLTVIQPLMLDGTDLCCRRTDLRSWCLEGVKSLICYLHGPFEGF